MHKFKLVIPVLIGFIITRALLGVNGMVTQAVADTTPNTPNTTYTVTNTDSWGPGSLADAVGSANNGDTINIVVSGTIRLSWMLDISGLTINGPGSDQLTITFEEDTDDQVFIASAYDTSLNGMTIMGGHASSEGEENMPDGGGVNCSSVTQPSLSITLEDSAPARSKRTLSGPPSYTGSKTALRRRAD